MDDETNQELYQNLYNGDEDGTLTGVYSKTLYSDVATGNVDVDEISDFTLENLLPTTSSVSELIGDGGGVLLLSSSNLGGIEIFDTSTGKIDDELIGGIEKESIICEADMNGEDLNAGNQIDGDGGIVFAEAITVIKYKCKFCDQDFDSIHLVQNHYFEAHTGNSTVQESLVDAVLSSSETNVSEHSSDVPATIPPRKRKSTHKSLSSSKNKYKHKFKKTRRKRIRSHSRRYACDWPNCDYVAAYSHHLSDHKRLHTGERPFRCNWIECGQSFAQKSTLKQHMRSHTGEKPYQCDWPGCSLSFSQKSNMVSHRKLHTGDKPFGCDWPGCDSRFSNKGNLESHKKIHTGEGSLKCERGCDKSFPNQSQLRSHHKIHESVKPHHCDYPDCSYATRRLHDLHSHKRTHDDQAKFACQHCSKSYTRLSYLTKHTLTHHSTL